MKNKYSIFSLIKNAFSDHENWQQAWGNSEGLLPVTFTHCSQTAKERM